jgi:hypothetical protein
MPKILETWEVQPHGPLDEIDDGILTATGEIVMPLGRFPRRMTVLRLRGGRTAIWSAIALPEDDMARIEALGKPSVLIVPNPGHRLDSHIWKERYPDIKVLTPPGAYGDVEEAVEVSAVEQGAVEDALDDPAVRFVVVDGTDEAESALQVKRASGLTLIVNDIIGHVQHPHGLGATIMAHLFDYGTDEPSIPKTVKRYITDPAALASQLRAWAALDPVRIIVSHGDPITVDPAGQLRRLAGELESR